MERNDAWQRLFAKLPILDAVAKDGLCFVSADQLKTYGGREPRLMAKIDTLAEVPSILAENGLALFPVRNGHYVLFPDPEQKCFFRFPKDENLPLRSFQSKVDLNQFDTYPSMRLASESQALDFAFISSLLTTFCGDESMRLTMRGRFFSNAFDFLTPIKPQTIAVDRVQIEIDAGYEGDKGLYLIEAKRGRRDNFHIRQLWYPYLHWAAHTQKPVMPIFFAYSNGQYFLTEMGIGQAYGDLHILRNRAYCLEAAPQPEIHFSELLKKIEVGVEPEIQFPQANDLDKVVDVVLATANGPITKTYIAELFDMDERQGDYYGSAGCYLGLLKRQHGQYELTETGQNFSTLKTRCERTQAMVWGILRQPCFNQAMKLVMERNFRVEKIFPNEFAHIIAAQGKLSGTTPLRRASTLRAWMVWIFENVKLL